jgi:hypothetical protein
MKLADCPFCEGEAEIIRYGDRKVSTQYGCTNCGCFLETGETFNHGAQWNTRPLEDYNQEALMFMIRVAHILFCEGLTTNEKLACIKLRYRQISFLEIPFTEQEERLLARIK